MSAAAPPLAARLAALGALAARRAAPAAAERLVASLSNHRVMVTSNFTGEELVLFGGIEQDAGVAARAAAATTSSSPSAGPRQTLVTFRKARVLGIWVNADSRVFENAPAYLAVLVQPAARRHHQRRDAAPAAARPRQYPAAAARQRRHRRRRAGRSVPRSRS